MTTDQQKVNIILKSPLNSPLSGWVEVIGTPKDSNNINCDEVSLLG